MNIDDIIENAQLKGRVIGLEAQVETLTAEVRCLEAVIRAHERIDCQAVANLKAEVARLNSLIANNEDENARLKAEVEELTGLLKASTYYNSSEEVTNLKAEVERLTKELENTDCMFAMASAFARDWNAAKEGN